MKGVEIHYRRCGRNFALTHQRLRDRMPHADGTANPKLWWVQEVTAGSDRDWIACGVKTKREAIAAIDEECAR